MSQSNTELRQDITGLRAVAVLAVTLYHIAHVLSPNNTLFRGGFLGVDIFFVISGFLMTKIIITGLERENFSLYTFYKRRAKRICPALFVTVLVFVAVSILILDTEYLINTCCDGLRALGFISNFWFARQTGYFDGAATDRIFLHTWSLSVEWQFYLVYPLLLILANKLVSRKVLGILILILTVVSLIFGCLYTLHNPINSYYLLPSRAYELLIGGLAYFYPLSFFLNLFNMYGLDRTEEAFRGKIAKYIEFFGLFCILVSFFVVDSSNGWPNAWSILPLVGTYLCIAANNRKTILSNVAFQKLGLWSYAVYLVHWPLIVFISKFSWSSVSWYALVFILIFGIVLHYGVERKRNFGWGVVVCYFIMAGSLQWIISTKGDVFRKDVPIIGFPGGDRFNSGKPYAFGNLSRPVDFILTGDSYARHYVSSLEKYNLHVVTIILDGCFSSKNLYNDPVFSREIDYRTRCRDRYLHLEKVVAKYPDVPIIWGQNWPEYSKYPVLNRKDQVIEIDVYDIFNQELQAISNDLLNSQNRIYFLGKPRAGDLDTNAELGKQCYPLYKMDNFLSLFIAHILGCRDIVPILDEPEANVRLKSIIGDLSQNQNKNKKNWPVTYIDPSEAYCDSKGCRIMQADTFEPLFFDGGHFSKYGADIALEYIIDQLISKEAEYRKADKDTDSDEYITP